MDLVKSGTSFRKKRKDLIGLGLIKRVRSHQYQSNFSINSKTRFDSQNEGTMGRIYQPKERMEICLNPLKYGEIWL